MVAQTVLAYQIGVEMPHPIPHRGFGLGESSLAGLFERTGFRPLNAKIVDARMAGAAEVSVVSSGEIGADRFGPRGSA